MANTQAERRFILDTAGSTAVASKSYKINRIQVVSTPASPAGHTVITDLADKIRWEWYGNTDKEVEEWWFDGFKLTVLEGGIVYIHTC